MKTFPRLRFLLPGILLMLSSSLRANNPNAETLRLLRELRIPELRFQEADLQDALRFLTQVSREADPDGVGLNLVYFAPKEGEPAPRKITLELRNVPLGDALHLMTEISGTVYRVERGVVRVGTRQDQRLETRFYPVDAGQFKTFQERTQGK